MGYQLLKFFDSLLANDCSVDGICYPKTVLIDHDCVAMVHLNLLSVLT